MLSLVGCRCLFRLMRRCFLGRWICLLVSERFRLVWKCRLFNIIKHNLRTSMNERTHLFIEIYILHTLFSMFLWCLRKDWRQGQTAILTKLLLLTIEAPLPYLGWSCSTGDCWGPQPPVCKRTLIMAFIPTDSTAAGTCLYSFITPTCFRFFFFFFRLFTKVHLLIDGSVKGQYITQSIIHTTPRWR